MRLARMWEHKESHESGCRLPGSQRSPTGPGWAAFLSVNNDLGEPLTRVKQFPVDGLVSRKRGSQFDILALADPNDCLVVDQHVSRDTLSNMTYNDYNVLVCGYFCICYRLGRTESSLSSSLDTGWAIDSNRATAVCFSSPADISSKINNHDYHALIFVYFCSNFRSNRTGT